MMMSRTPRPISGSTLGNGLLLAAAAATLSFAALLLPLSKLVDRAPLNVADWAGLLFIPVVILATGLGILHSRRRQHRLLRAVGVVDEHDSIRHELVAIAPELDESRVAVALTGTRPPVDPDPSVPTDPPRIVLPGTTSSTLLIASRTYARLQRDRGAFRAVLLHEIGHNLLRDTQRIDDIRRLIFAGILCTVVTVSLSIHSSYLVDCPTGWCRDALIATIIGKGVLWSAFALVIVLAWIRGLLERLREHIADNFVFDSGEPRDALDRAEDLLGRSPHSTPQRRNSRLTFTFRWWIAFGLATGLLIIHVTGLLDYAASLHVSSRTADVLRAAAVVLFDHGFVLFAFIVLSRRIREHDVPDALSSALDVTAAALLAAWGNWLAYLLGHVLPNLAIPFMPRAYDNVFRSDIPALLWQTFTSTLHSNLTVGVVLAALLLACVAAAANARTWAIARWAFIVAVALSAVAELALRTGQLTAPNFGLLRLSIVGLIASAAAILLSIRLRPTVAPVPVIVVVASVAVWLGLTISGQHEMSLDTSTRFTAAQAARERGDVARATALLEEVVASAPQIAAGWMQLGDAYEAAGRTNVAADAFTTACGVRGLASWDARVECFYRAGDALLDRRAPHDLERARRMLGEVTRMRNLNSRLDKAQVAGALMVYSGVLTQSASSRDRAEAMLFLVEADARAPQQHVCDLVLRAPALRDTFAPLRLADGPMCDLELDSFESPEIVLESLEKRYSIAQIDCFTRKLVRVIAARNPLPPPI